MATTLQIQPLPLPLKLDKTGVVRVGGTRVTLDTVVRAFVRGATAEEIAQQYPSLILSDIYATISYYLQNQEEVESILKIAESTRKPSNVKIKKGSTNLEFGKDYWRVKTNSHVASRRR